METAITAKLSLNVDKEELKLLEAVSCAYRDACNMSPLSPSKKGNTMPSTSRK